MEATLRFSTFHLAGHYFGIDVLAVQEILRPHEMTKVPLAPSQVEGLINLRGQIVTAVDLRRPLGMAPRGEEEPFMNVVVTERGEPVSLIVDGIGDVIETSANLREPVPDTVTGPVRQAVKGVFKLPGQLLLELDPSLALQIHSASSLKESREYEVA